MSTPETMTSDAIPLTPEVVSPRALEVITRAEIDVQVATAKRYPRSLQSFKTRAMAAACLDAETAESCFYALPRDGKAIEGESVRLAEICAAMYGNLRIGGRIIDEGPEFLTAQGICADLESNVVYAVEVKRRITGKNGRRYNTDLIATTGNAAVSIAVRNAIFRAIPKAYVRPIYLAAKRTAVGDEKTLAVRRDAAVAYFVGQGVTRERLLQWLNKDGIADIGLPELELLTGLRTAVKDGEVTLAEAFPEPKPETPAAGGDRASQLAAEIGKKAPAEREPGADDA